MTKNGLELTNSTLSTLKSLIESLKPRVARLIPNTVDEYNHILSETSESGTEDSLTFMLAESTINKPTMEWIEENGICMDNIKPGKSVIPYASRGAIANRYIEKGSIVTPVPLLNIVDKDLLKIWDVVDEETGKFYDQDELGDKAQNIIGEQIILNYCFGHIKSKLILCPQSNAILINHCSSRTGAIHDHDSDGNTSCSIEGPNARLQWASGWDPDTADWLKMSLDVIEEKTKEEMRGLSLEIVAMRDILPGEEVTIDYGENWEKAWEKHVKNWVAPSDDLGISYIPIRELIEKKDFRTIDELTENPYPDNAQLICYVYTNEEEAPERDVEKQQQQEQDNEMEEQMSGHDFIPVNGMHEESYISPCEILKRPEGVTGGDGYTVRVYEASGRRVRLTHYPEESISFQTKKYKSDMHLRGTFRHFIEIDDEIFPESWKEKH